MEINFKLRTNHNDQKYLFEQQTFNVTETNLLKFLNKYDFEIKYIIRKENKVNDALNGRAISLDKGRIIAKKCILEVQGT
jgi:hypothetical protein